MIEVLRGGMLTTVQDGGRRGYQRLGVIVGGAADSFAARVLNLLVGNPADAAVLEMAFAGPKLRFEIASFIAWGGADFIATLDGRPLSKNRPVPVPAGGVVDIPTAKSGAMAWLAVAGGLDVPLVMNSRSTDLAGGFGGFEGRALKSADRLELGAATRVPDCGGTWAVIPERLVAVAGPGVVRVMRGPEWEWFSDEARKSFVQTPWEVTKDGNRVGVRLHGLPLTLAEPREMISSAVDHGVIQVPPSGQPIVLGPDRQTLGGYPRIGVVATVDLGKLAQLRPGDSIKFHEIQVREAHDLLLRRERDLAVAAACLGLRRVLGSA
jgi:antagonist of KipI